LEQAAALTAIEVLQIDRVARFERERFLADHLLEPRQGPGERADRRLVRKSGGWWSLAIASGRREVRRRSHFGQFSRDACRAARGGDPEIRFHACRLCLAVLPDRMVGRHYSNEVPLIGRNDTGLSKRLFGRISGLADA